MTATDEVVIPAPATWSRSHVEQMAALILLLNSRHRGKANGISASALAAQLCVHERLLRSLVSEARAQGHPISATPETGYYLAQTADEVRESCAFLRSRAMTSLRIEAQLLRIPLRQLLSTLPNDEEGDAS